MNYTELINRIEELKSRKGRGSISADETFSLLMELAEKTKAVDINAGSLTIRRLYTSVTAMNADQNPVDQETSKPLRFGQLVCVCNSNDLTQADNGKIYRYNKPGWEFLRQVGDMVQFARTEDVSSKMAQIKKELESVETDSDDDVRFLYGSSSHYFSESGYIDTSGNFVNSANWRRTQFIPVSQIKKILTFAGLSNSAIPAIAYHSSINAGSFVGCEFADISIKTTTANIYGFRKIPDIPRNAQYAVINCFNLYLNNTYILGKLDIQDIQKEIYEGDHPAIQNNLTRICVLNSYVRNDGLIVDSAAWKRSGFIDVNLLNGILKTYAGNSDSIIPAISYYSSEDYADMVSVEFADPLKPSPTGSVYIYERHPVIPDRAKFAIINCFSTYIASGYMQDIITLRTLSGRVGYLESIAEPPNSANKTIMVRKNPSSGEYGTISEGLSKAVKGDLIYVFEGVYEEYGLSVVDGISMIGIGNVEIRGELPASSSTAMIDVTSTIDMFNGGKLENLTVTAKNMRYPIHADFSNGNTEKTVRNCRFIHYGNSEAYQYRVSAGTGTQNEIFRAMSAWGGGTKAGDRVYIDGCYFESPMRAFSIHNNAAFNNSFGASIVKVVNSRMVSHGVDFDGSDLSFLVSVHIQSLESGTPDRVIFENCEMNGYICFQSAPTHEVYTDSMKLKQIWSTAGGSKVITQQWKLLDVNWYPKIKGEITALKNVGTSKLLRGKAVKKTGIGIDLFTNADPVSRFLGILMQDTDAGKAGDVKYAGYIPYKYLTGSEYTVAEGSDISVDSFGNFILGSAFTIMKAVDNNNILIR